MAMSISSVAAESNNNNNKRVLLVAAVALVLACLSASPSAVSARRNPVRLRLYMHDIVGGPGQTAVRLVKGPGPENPSMHPGNYFGDTVAVDDLLTEDLAVDSAPAGRARGTYMTGSMSRPVFVVAVTLLLTAGPYNGSTLVVAGHDDTSLPVRELAVVGGTGALRRAAGHVLWSTARVESALHAVLLLDGPVWFPPGRTCLGQAALPGVRFRSPGARIECLAGNCLGGFKPNRPDVYASVPAPSKAAAAELLLTSA